MIFFTKGEELNATKNISFTKEMVEIHTMAESSQNLVGCFHVLAIDSEGEGGMIWENGILT